MSKTLREHRRWRLHSSGRRGLAGGLRAGRLAAVVAVLLTAMACTAGQSTDGPGRPSSSDSSASSGTNTASSSPESSPFKGAWIDATADALGVTGDWTNKVELADIDSDGDVDILFANGGDYDTAGKPVASRVFMNNGAGKFQDATQRVFGKTKALARVIKVADVNGDSAPDVALGTTYDSQSRLFLGSSAGGWTDVTQKNFPAADLSAGDLEFGDVDGDKDLDIVIADWGDGSPLGRGGKVVLWLNNGAGKFTEAAPDQIPKTLVQFSWDLELLDVDNDWDLDLAVSCKTCPTSLLFINDGSGTFADASGKQMPAFPNNYEFAPIDLDGDRYLDLVTINDGPTRSAGLSEHVFRNDGTGAFVDVTDKWWPEQANPGWDDNVVVGLDVESDGDADFLVGSLDGPDRLLINDGSGGLALAQDVFDAPASQGTLGLAVADLNDDGRLDVVEAQGEVSGHESEKVYFGTSVLKPDTAPPVVHVAVMGQTLLARVHDNRTPNMPHDWQSVAARWDGGGGSMTWYGENLFQADLPAGAKSVEVCAVDASGNQSCAKSQ